MLGHLNAEGRELVERSFGFTLRLSLESLFSQLDFSPPPLSQSLFTESDPSEYACNQKGRES